MSGADFLAGFSLLALAGFLFYIAYEFGLKNNPKAQI